MSPPPSPATVPPSAAGSRARFPHLDALRGIAALSVAGFHFVSEMPGTWFTALFSKGWLGVEVFFVISGFILPCALQARGSYSFPRHYPHFLWKRILRLHPPYLATLGIVLATWYVCSRVPGWPVSALAITWQEVAAHPFLLNDVLGLRWVSDVFWTLAIEFQFYLLIGALFPLLANRGRWLPAVGSATRSS